MLCHRLESGVSELFSCLCIKIIIFYFIFFKKWIVEGHFSKFCSSFSIIRDVLHPPLPFLASLSSYIGYLAAINTPYRPIIFPERNVSRSNNKQHLLYINRKQFDFQSPNGVGSSRKYTLFCTCCCCSSVKLLRLTWNKLLQWAL